MDCHGKRDLATVARGIQGMASQAHFRIRQAVNRDASSGSFQNKLAARGK
jgi:hypothetical protein